MSIKMKKPRRHFYFGLTGLTAMGTHVLNENIGDALPLKDAPAPFDYFNHAENLSFSFCGGALLTVLSALGVRRWGSEEAKSRAGKVATSVAVGAMAAINAAVEITEIRYGMHGIVTGLTDGGYGIGGAALGAASVDVEGIIGRPIPQQPEDNTLVQPSQTAPPTNPDFR